MKKIVKFVSSALLIAAAAIGVTSCVNPNDESSLIKENYKDYDMYIDALVLNGLSSTYNDEEVEISIKYKGNDGAEKTVTVTDTVYVGQYGSDPLIAGTAFVKFTNPILIDFADDVASSDAVVKVSLTVNGKTIQAADETFGSYKAAELAAPTSSYQTKNEDLPHRYITVNTATDAIGTNIPAAFAFEKIPTKDGATDFSSVIPYLVEVNYICGNQGNFALTKSSTDDNGVEYYYATFVFDETIEAWSNTLSHEGKMQFGITNDTSWSTKYTGATGITVGDKKTFTATTKAAGDNNEVSGLVNGKTYTVYVKVDGSKVSVAVINTEIKVQTSDTAAVNLGTFAKQSDGSYLSTTTLTHQASWGFGLCDDSSWSNKFVLIDPANLLTSSYQVLGFEAKNNCKVSGTETISGTLSIKIEGGKVSAKFE